MRLSQGIDPGIRAFSGRKKKQNPWHMSGGGGSRQGEGITRAGTNALQACSSAPSAIFSNSSKKAERGKAFFLFLSFCD